MTQNESFWSWLRMWWRFFFEKQLFFSKIWCELFILNYTEYETAYASSYFEFEIFVKISHWYPCIISKSFWMSCTGDFLLSPSAQKFPQMKVHWSQPWAPSSTITMSSTHLQHSEDLARTTTLRITLFCSSTNTIFGYQPDMELSFALLNSSVPNTVPHHLWHNILS